MRPELSIQQKQKVIGRTFVDSAFAAYEKKNSNNESLEDDDNEEKIIEPIFSDAPQPERKSGSNDSSVPSDQNIVKKEVTVNTPQISQVKKTIKPTLKNISISSINAGASNNTIVSEDAASYETTDKILKSKPFTQEELSKKWNEFVNSLEEDVHVLKSLERSELTYQNDASFLIKVDNSLQEKMIHDLKAEILIYLKKELQNDSITFTVSVEENITKKPVTLQDKFNELLEKNEDFRRLADELSLEI
ncbi:hypothetical protein LJC11_04590 [Bacteroidales bacterium OttesenSCG-928-I21]|nr:hypothetical protein [Bacteroidales bacterium OttesenSCG-928-I21]